MNINLTIIQPAGYIHSLCFLDTARYLRHHLRSFGIDARISKNLQDPSCVNVVFGAHLGLPDGWEINKKCVWFNQEQIGDGGPQFALNYLRLLSTGHVIDYDPANIASYGRSPSEAKASDDRLCELMPLLHAPFLEADATASSLEERPIDLLFFGSMNNERRQLIQRIEDCGVSVSWFDHPIYGPERDAYIAQAKAVLNIPFYESNRFEQVRAFNALSIGTPVVSLRRTQLRVPAAYEPSVHWFTDEGLEAYFRDSFGSADWLSNSRQQLARWRANSPEEEMASLAAALQRLSAQPSPSFKTRAGNTQRLNLAADRRRISGWLNVAATPSPGADAVLDLTQVQAPSGRELEFHAADRSTFTVKQGSVKEIVAVHDLIDAKAAQRLVTNVVDLLEDGGVFVLECPVGLYTSDAPALSTAQDLALARMRAILDAQLALGEGDGTLELEDGQSVGNPSALDGLYRYHIRLQHRRRPCTPRELVLRRVERMDFGSFPEDGDVAPAYRLSAVV